MNARSDSAKARLGKYIVANTLALVFAWGLGIGGLIHGHGVWDSLSIPAALTVGSILGFFVGAACGWIACVEDRHES